MSERAEQSAQRLRAIEGIADLLVGMAFRDYVPVPDDPPQRQPMADGRLIDPVSPRERKSPGITTEQQKSSAASRRRRICCTAPVARSARCFAPELA